MKTISKKQLSREFLNALDESGEEPLLIDLPGQKFVVLKEEDYRGWCETAHLLSSSKNAKILQEALEEPLYECRDLKIEELSWEMGGRKFKIREDIYDR